MHPAVEAYIRKFEEEAAEKGSYRARLGPNERAFLELVWGPEFNYQFEGLHAEYPLKDYKGWDRFADFTYIRGSLRLLIEIDDYTTHARPISSWDFGDHLMRQNDMVLEGWVVLRFTATHVRKMPMMCRRQIKQAIGNWWVRTQSERPFRGMDRAKALRDKVIEMALQNDGSLKPADIARTLGITRTTAMKWLRTFSEEGWFDPVRANERIVGYRLRQR